MTSFETQATNLLNASMEETNPSSPPVLELVDASNGTFHISWNIYDDGGYEITKYIVGVINTSSDSNQSFTYEVNGSSTQLRINNDLVPTSSTGSPTFVVDDTYIIYVVGVNSIGSTSLSNALEETVTLRLPGIPVISSYNVGIDGTLNLIINQSGTTSSNDGPVTFDILIQGSSEILEKTDITSSFSTIRGLSQGLSYDVSVKASNNLGSSSYSPPFTVSIPDALPASLEYEPLSPPSLEAKAYDRKIIISWSNESTHSACILKLRDLSTNRIYLYEYTGTDEQETFIFSSLVNNNAYEVSAMRFDASGVSSYSAPVQLTPQKTPDPVTSIEAVFCGDGVIHVFYQYPNAVPGHTYSFILTAYNETDPNVSPISSGPISDLDYKFMNLVDKDVYTIVIQAFDMVTNDASNLVNVGDNIIATSVVCFLEGTHLQKGRNEWVVVEEVKVGDFLWSPSIRDIAQVTHIYKQVLPVHPKTLPICLEKEDPRFQLKRDLFLSPMHAVYLNGKFFEARHVPYAESVSVETKQIIYYNIELEKCRNPFQYTLCAEGLIVESHGDRNSIVKDGIAYEYKEESFVAFTS